MLNNDRIYQLRTRAKMTRRKLSELSGTTENTLYLIESGRKTFADTRIVDGIAKALGVEPGSLLT